MKHEILRNALLDVFTVLMIITFFTIFEHYFPDKDSLINLLMSVFIGFGFFTIIYFVFTKNYYTKTKKYKSVCKHCDIVFETNDYNRQVCYDKNCIMKEKGVYEEIYRIPNGDLIYIEYLPDLTYINQLMESDYHVHIAENKYKKINRKDLYKFNENDNKDKVTSVYFDNITSFIDDDLLEHINNNIKKLKPYYVQIFSKKVRDNLI